MYMYKLSMIFSKNDTKPHLLTTGFISLYCPIDSFAGLGYDLEMYTWNFIQLIKQRINVVVIKDIISLLYSSQHFPQDD